MSPQSFPLENEIAQNYGVSRVTVRKVLDELEQEGLINTNSWERNFCKQRSNPDECKSRFRQRIMPKSLKTAEIIRM